MDVGRNDRLPLGETTFVSVALTLDVYGLFPGSSHGEAVAYREVPSSDEALRSV